MLVVEAVEKWAKALESGEYIQGFQFMRNARGREERFCALGVLCDISGVGRWEPLSDSPKILVYVATARSSAVYPPQEVVRWAGLDDGAIDEVIHLNDADGTEFADMAKHLRGLLAAQEAEVASGART